jgi:hypothetical protein
MAEGGEWLVRFRGRKASGMFEQNFVWRHGNIYVMDNHRAAMWCWMQHVEPRKPHALFHIDRHPDTLQSRMNEWLANLPRSWNISIEEYLTQTYVLEGAGHALPVFSWDNYLSIYLALFGENITSCYFATHRDGDNPNHERAMHVDVWDVPFNLNYWLGGGVSPWIVNIDLDYFFCDGENDRAQRMLADVYIDQCMDVVGQKMQDGTIAVTTIALTPVERLTGGWEPSEALAARVLACLGIEFRLP